MATTQILSHGDAAIARLPDKHKGKVKLEAFIRSLLDPADTLESAMYALLTERSIDTAVGVQLDGLGAIVVQPRSGVSDDIYRRRIRARISVNKSKGDWLSLFDVARLIIDDASLTVRLDNERAATVVLRVLGVAMSDELSTILIGFLFDTVAAGVRILLEYKTDLNAFRFAGGTGAARGFGVGKFSSVKSEDSSAEYGSPPTASKLLDLKAAMRPVTQELPADGTAWDAAYPSISTPDHIYRMNEAAGSLLDQVGALDWAVGGAGWALRQQNFNAWNGSDFSSYQCIESDGTAGTFDAPNNTLIDADGVTSFAVLGQFRSHREAATSRVIYKRTGGDLHGWQFVFNSTTTTLFLDYGATFAQSSVSVDVLDGVPVTFLAVFDATAGTAQLFTSRGDGSPITYDATTAAATPALLGGSPTPDGCQLGYMAIWTGAAAEALGAATVTTFHQHATDGSGLLTTTHTGLSEIIADDSGFGIRVGDYGDNQHPIGYDAGILSNNRGHGLVIRPAATNLVPDSDDFTGWTSVATTISTTTANMKDSSRGFREAQQITASGFGGYREKAYTTTAGTEYTQALLLRSGSGTVTGRLVMFDLTGAAEIAATSFTLTTDWQLVLLTATTAAGQVSTGFRVEIDNNTEVIHPYLATAVLGDSYALIHTSGGTATRTATVHTVTGTAGQHILNNKGMLRVRAVANVAPTSDVYLADWYDATFTKQRGYLLLNSVVEAEVAIFDSGGTVVDTLVTAVTATDENELWLSWDDEASAETIELWDDSVVGDDSSVAYDGGADDVTIVGVGTDAGVAQIFDGLISMFEVWDELNATP